MRRYLPFLIPFAVIVAAGLGARLFFAVTADKPCDTVSDVDWADVGLDTRCVRVKGMAHYPAVIRQVQTNPFQDDSTYFVFPLFSSHDNASRGIRVLVRTTRPPERLVSYEYMVIEGKISPVTPEKVPFSSEIALSKKSEYFFEDDVVLLEPHRIESDGEVWTPPQ